MNEIEKIQRYIKRTKVKEIDRFSLDMASAFELARKAQEGGTASIEAISLAFSYGKAKGFRAAKAEVRA